MESIRAARALVDECIHAWTQNTRAEIRALVEHAFQTDKAGRINVSRILGLTRLAIEDEKWQRAMTAIRESMQIGASKAYIRLYERVGEGDRYEPIALNMAAL